MGFGVWFGTWGLGLFRVQGLRVWGLGFGLGLGVWGLGLKLKLPLVDFVFGTATEPKP